MDINLLPILAARFTLAPADFTENQRNWGMVTLISSELAATSRAAIPGFNGRVPAYGTISFPDIPAVPEIEAKIELYDEELNLLVIHLSQRLDPPGRPVSDDFMAELPPPSSRWESLFVLPPAMEKVLINGNVLGVFEDDIQTRILLSAENTQTTLNVLGAPVVVDGKLAGVVWTAPVKSEIPEPDEVQNLYTAMPISAIRSFLDRKAGEVVRKTFFSSPPDGESANSSQDAPPHETDSATQAESPSDTEDAADAATTVVLDEVAFFRRLNGPAKRALGIAEGIRRVRDRQHLHIEYLLAGLLENEDGPSRALFLKHEVDDKKFAELVQQTGRFTLPARSEYEPVNLTALPATTRRVRRALKAAQDVADSLSAPQIQTRHLLFGALSMEDSRLVNLLHDAGVVPAEVPLSRTQYRGPQSIAYVNADNPEGDDLLNIQPDVDALSAVISAKDVLPPLSIGLFGDWGSGKSFFMNKMDARIRELTKLASESPSAYCSNIVQIWFNAWSYVEADLWASLVTDIFEALARAIETDGTLTPGSNPATAKARLLAAMASARDVVAEEERRKDAAQAELEAVEQHIVTLKATDAELERRLGVGAVLKDAYRVVAREPAIRSEIDRAASRLKIPQAQLASTEAKARLLEIKGLWSGLRFAFESTNSLKVWVFPIAALAAMAGLWYLLPNSLKDRVGSVIGTTTSLVIAGAATLAPLLRKASSAVSIINQIRENHRTRINEARQKIETDSKTQQREVREKLTAAGQRVEDAKAEIKRLDDTLKEMRADKQLLKFIRDRSLSQDYTSRLGTVARARRDFRQLSDLMDRAREEKTDDPSTMQPGQHDEQLLPRIDRIVLYIDDLDRCNEADVVKVLEAVHLLLAFKLFVVIVAVDSRWLLQSLRKHSAAFQTFAGAGMEISAEERAHWESTPLNYLEKIFQIPFYLRPMRGSGFERLVDEVAGERGVSKTEVQSDAVKLAKPAVQSQGDPNLRSVDPDSQPADSREKNKDTRAGGSGSGDGSGSKSSESSRPGESTTASTARTADETSGSREPNANSSTTATTDADKKATKGSPGEANPIALRIEEWERKFMKKLHPLIMSPRSAKRFINIYRLLRVSIIDENELAAFVGNARSGQHRAALLLLAILTGYPAEATDILRDLTESEHNETWWAYIDGIQAELPTETTGTELKIEEQRIKAQRWLELLEKLRQLRSEIPESQSCDHFVKWAPRVARYSFQSGRVLGSLNEDALND